MSQVALNDPDPLMYHGEVVYRNGIIVGDVRAASYGHTLGGAVGACTFVRMNHCSGAPLTLRLRPACGARYDRVLLLRGGMFESGLLCFIACAGLSMVETDEPITSKWIASGTWEVDIAGRRYPARASLRPMYDPKNEKIKAI